MRLGDDFKIPEKKYFTAMLIPFIVFILIILSHFPTALSRRLNEVKVVQSPDHTQKEQHEKLQSKLLLSKNIPPLHDTIDLVLLSSVVYDFEIQHATNCSSFQSIYNQFASKDSEYSSMNSNVTFHCHHYIRNDQDTQLLIVSRQSLSTPTVKKIDDESEEADDNSNFIAVVFAGTDDFRNTLTDSNILKKHFGPYSYNDDDHNSSSGGDNRNHNTTNRTYYFPPESDDIRVHAGFNNAVFKNGLFDKIFDTVKDYKEQHPNAKIYTSGHSLGASDSVLTAVALKIQSEFQDDDIDSINFGCPKTGNSNWRDYVNGIKGLGIWRIVNGLDLVPRLPGPTFHHVGHTVQLYDHDAKGYWLHVGNETLGYVGVPAGWNSLSYILSPVAAIEHLIGRYYRYLTQHSRPDPKTFYIDGFETEETHIDGDIPQDNEVSDEGKRKIAQQIAQQYMHYMKKEQNQKKTSFPINEEDLVVEV